MKNEITILTITYSDNDYDSINYAYLKLSRKGLETLLEIQKSYQAVHRVAETVKNMDFYAFEGLDVTFLYEVPEHIESRFNEETDFLTDVVLTEEELEAGTSDVQFYTQGDYLRFTYEGLDVQIKSDYKHAVGGINAGCYVLTELEQIFGGTE